MFTYPSRGWLTYLFGLLWLGCLTAGRAQTAGDKPPLIWYVPQGDVISGPIARQGSLEVYTSWQDLAGKLAQNPSAPYHLHVRLNRRAADWQALRQLRPATSVSIQLADSSAADSLLPILAGWTTLQTLRISGEDRPRSTTILTDPKTGERTIKSTVPDYPLPRVGWEKLASLTELTLGDGVALEQALEGLRALPNLHTLKLEGFMTAQIGLPNTLAGMQQIRQLVIQWSSSTENYKAAFSGLANLETLDISVLNAKAFDAVLPNLRGLTTLKLSVPRNVSAVSMVRLGQLPALRTLHLDLRSRESTTPLDLTTTFAGLTTLEEVTLKNVLLASIPSSLLKNSGLRKLSIEEAGLTALPDSLGQLARLTHLSLDRNPLSQLPAAIGRLPQLDYLSLNQCGLETLPDAIGDLGALTYLSLAANQLTHLPASVGWLRNLRQLNLTQNQLTTLPPELAQLPRLETLVVVWNQLTELPPNLHTLSHLYAAENEIATLPSLNMYRHLRSLTLNGNLIGQLPNSIGDLDSLETLELGNNGLTYLPASLGKLRRLRSLTIGPNQVRELPATLGGLSSLTSLVIRQNPIEALPPSIGNWVNLRMVRLELPRLRNVPEQIGNWQRLEDLTVESDELVLLPEQVADCQHLKALSINGARFIGLPERVGQLSRLTDLIVSGRVDTTTGLAVGRLQALPTSLARCQRLMNLKVHHQPQFDANEALQLATQLPALERLTLADCQLAELSHVAWDRLIPTYLNLVQNQLSQLPLGLLSMPRLREADFSLNNLPASLNRSFMSKKQLSDVFDKLKE